MTFPNRAAPPRQAAGDLTIQLAMTARARYSTPTTPNLLGSARLGSGKSDPAWPGRSRASVGFLACPLRLSPPWWQLRSCWPCVYRSSGCELGGADGSLCEGKLCPLSAVHLRQWNGSCRTSPGCLGLPLPAPLQTLWGLFGADPFSPTIPDRLLAGKASSLPSLEERTGNTVRVQGCC